MTSKKDYSILVGGQAGQGSRKAGLIVAKILSQLGYNIFIYDDYQSLIRGGHSFSQVRASEKEVLSHRQSLDLLLALDGETISEHQQQVQEGGVVIYDTEATTLLNENAIGVNLGEIVNEFGGISLMKNVALCAAFSKVGGIKWEILEKVLKKEFPKFEEQCLNIARSSYEKTENMFEIEDLNKPASYLLTGNEALSLGAVKAGLDLYIAYPMTPATGILHFLAQNEKEFGIETVQLESELSVANASAGAAYTGAKTMLGTSGGGFALMTETLSLAAQNETPLVFINSQRMSPGSGVPTYNAQGDLSFVLGAGHGDIVKFVIAPGDANEACYWAGEILNLAWKYQTPAILLIDKEISESTFSFDKEILAIIENKKSDPWDGDGEYKRYLQTETGISPMAFPGQKDVICKSNSYEHDEFGISVEKEELVIAMQNKRLRKFEEMRKEVSKLKAVNVYGKENSKKAIICWGSTKGAAKEAAEHLGIKVLQPLILEPFPNEQMQEALRGVKKIALVETNATGQLEKVLNAHNIKIDKKILKYDARPFLPEEIIKELEGF